MGDRKPDCEEVLGQPLPHGRKGKMTYPDDMDPECIPLCDAINCVPGLYTTSSCCGHGREPFSIWFRCDSLRSLPILLYFIDSCHARVIGWKCEVYTDCGMALPTFMVTSGVKGKAAYREAEDIAHLVTCFLRKSPEGL